MATLTEKLAIAVTYWQTKRLSKRLNNLQKLKAYQSKRLNKHLRFLKRYSPFYKNKLGRAPSLSDCPIIEKEDMMTNFNSINTANLTLDEVVSLALKSEESRDFSPMLGDISVGLSSGTSGHRGVFLANSKERSVWAGSILAKCLPDSLLKPHKIALFLRANNQLYETLDSNHISFSFFDIYHDMPRNIERFNTLKPDILTAPPSVLSELADAQLDGRLIGDSLRVIYSSAEVMEDDIRQKIKSAFKCPVREIYQCTEGFLGTSCEYGTLHLNEEYLIIEEQKIDDIRFHPIITDLKRKTQPIVRYLLNDILHRKKAPCLCGSPYLAIERIEGRADDVIRFPSQIQQKEITVYPDMLRRMIIKAEVNILDYRIVQTDTYTLKIDIQINGNTDSDSAIHAIDTQFQKLREQLELPNSVLLKIESGNSAIFKESGTKLRRIRGLLR
jgi:putative adenylate-forming enzyme